MQNFLEQDYLFSDLNSYSHFLFSKVPISFFKISLCVFCFKFWKASSKSWKHSISHPRVSMNFFFLRAQWNWRIIAFSVNVKLMAFLNRNWQQILCCAKLHQRVPWPLCNSPLKHQTFLKMEKMLKLVGWRHGIL